MNALVQRLYWALPYSTKCWLASRNAHKLDAERFGSEYEGLVREITGRSHWTADQFLSHQRDALRTLIRHAATCVPYYRQQFAEAGLDPASIREIDDLQRVPVLEKATARANPGLLVDETLDRSALIVQYTSGTTGSPLALYRDVRVNSATFAFADARWHAAAGMCRRRNRSVSIGGHLVAEPGRRKPPFWVCNRRWNQLYMSSYHLSPANMDSYVAVLREFGADYIEGYPSSIHALASHVIERKLQPVPFKACFVTAETLFDFQREAIREAFGCRTHNQYGCGEFAAFACECPHGTMHLSPEVGIVEVLDDRDRPVDCGQTGRLVCTGLMNRVQPFIRYRLGDMGAIGGRSCPCGSEMPILSHIEGRVDAVLLTRDGRRIGRLDPVFKGLRGIREAQVVQDDWEQFRVRIVPSVEYTARMGTEVKESLEERLGPGNAVRVEVVDAIERTGAGKFRAVVCRLPEEARRRALGAAAPPSGG